MRYELGMKEHLADLHIQSRTLSIVEWIILILFYIKFSKANCREKREIAECIRSDCKIAYSYFIGYNDVWWGRYYIGRFDVFCSVGISLISNYCSHMFTFA